MSKKNSPSSPTEASETPKIPENTKGIDLSDELDFVVESTSTIDLEALASPKCDVLEVSEPETEPKTPEPPPSIPTNPKKNKHDKGEKAPAPIVIKKVKKHAHGHHGGAWKIAFADFVTAMMAFFLLMWLIAALNTSQKEGLAEYFKQPIKVALFGGDSMGNRKEIVKGGGLDTKQKDGQSTLNSKPLPKDKPVPDAKLVKAEEIKKLEQLKADINISMEQDPALNGLKKQLLMDVVNDGLRIQLIDNQNKPMFTMGSDSIDPEMQKVLDKIAVLLKNTPNKISIQGHTDANPYDNPDELQTSNWELSTQRANAARRALVKAGLDESKVMHVSGYASTVLLDKQNPNNPQNRRISIIVMKKDAEKSLLANE